MSWEDLQAASGAEVTLFKIADPYCFLLSLSLVETPPKLEDNPAEAFTDSSLFAHWGQELSPENRRLALKQFQYYGYNAYLSDRLPLDRALPDLRPSA